MAGTSWCWGRTPTARSSSTSPPIPAERTNLLGRPGTAEPSSPSSPASSPGSTTATPGRSLERSDGKLDATLERELADLGYVSAGHSQPRRAVPRRIEPADPFPNGRLGWANPGSVSNCAQMGKEVASGSLLAGWYEPDGTGRWSAQDGTLVLTAPQASSLIRPGLLVSGTNFRPSPVRVTLSVNHHAVLETELQAGPFHLSAPLTGVPLDTLDLVEIATDSEFVPSRVGLPDQRSLGLYLTTVCLEPDALAPRRRR